MPTINEKTIRPEIGTHGTTLPVRILNDNGTTARIQIEGCGVLLRQGAVHTVPSTAVQRSTH